MNGEDSPANPEEVGYNGLAVEPAGRSTDHDETHPRSDLAEARVRYAPEYHLEAFIGGAHMARKTKQAIIEKEALIQEYVDKLNELQILLDRESIQTQELQRQLGEKDTRIAELQGLLDNAAAKLNQRDLELETVMREKEQDIQGLHISLGERGKRVEELTHALKRREQELGYRLSEKEREIKELKRSLAAREEELLSIRSMGFWERFKNCFQPH
jgi:chromosome segregation ATPase